MTIYHFNDDAEDIRTQVLPSKKLFIIDAYNTLLLDEPVNNRKALRHGSIDFLSLWPQKKIMYSDDKESSLMRVLSYYRILHFFLEVYHSKHVDFGRRNQIPKDYEWVATSHGFSIDDVAIIEDWDPNDSRLTAIKIDYVIIPTQFNIFNAICTGTNIRRAIQEIRKTNGYTFSKLLPNS